MAITNTVRQIVKNLYNLDSVELKMLGGTLDKNFWLKDTTSGEEYILRIIYEPHFPGIAPLVDDMTEYLHSHGFQVPCLIPTNASGKRSIQTILEETGTDSQHLVQLCKFMHGKTLAETSLSVDDCHVVAEDLGFLLGRLNKCLQAYDGPNGSVSDFRQADNFTVWQTTNVMKLKKYAKLIDDVNMHEIIVDFFHKFEENISPILSQLRLGFAHGDFNDGNILLIAGTYSNEIGSKSSSVLEKYGIIDFADCFYGPTVFELTTCMAYVMSLAQRNALDPIRLAGKTLNGFQEYVTLSPTERRVIFHGTMARCVTSYIMSLRALHQGLHLDKPTQGHFASWPDILALLHNKGEREVTECWGLSP
ncbi:hydroxylysine kinase-like isoform X1 [Clavelina lepadiformis]|uniref:hydroxylysine kinase-like isoform X1 n=2 Tax=Clavelina lepadiformis TaxID=159417 RepID=UPI004041066C